MGATNKKKSEVDLSAGELAAKYRQLGLGEHPIFAKEEWRHQVACDHTLFGYWDWVVMQVWECVGGRG